MKLENVLAAAASAAVLGAGLPALAQSAAETAVEAAKQYAGTEITIAWEAGLQSLDPLNFSGPKWEELTGISINVIEIPVTEMFTKILQEHRAGTGAYDALNVIPSWMPDLVRAGALEPLDPFVDEFDYRDDLETIGAVYRDNQMMVGDTIYGLPDDGDVFVFYYRTDVLGDPRRRPPRPPLPSRRSPPVMKVAILAGGVGTRLAEETETRPKPMVEIGGRPILWHIMMHYARYGHAEFLLALGYKGEYIKRYVTDFARLHGDLTVDCARGTVTCSNGHAPAWRVHLIDTGIDTLTGGRIKRLGPWIGNEPFMLTWGDGVSDVDLDALVDFHRGHGRLATVTAVRPPARFGHLEFDGDLVREFSEKPQTAEGWINGAFFVLEPEVLDYIEGDETQWEREPMERLAREGQLMAYRHEGFWQCMDTLRDKRLLQHLWDTGEARWKTWA